MVANVLPIGLTEAQQVALERPFSKHEHGFLGKEPYILKSALRRRFGQVDSRWTNTEAQILSMDNDLIVVRLGVTLCGVTRYGIGTKPVTNTKNVKNQTTGEETKVDLEGFDLQRNIANAIKSATADALSRAAMEFNVGVYLKDAPRGSIGTPETLEKYLKTLPGYGGAHWAFTGGGDRVNDLMIFFGLDKEMVKNNIEPGKVVNRLSETSLNELQYTARLAELWKDELSRPPAQPINGSSVEPTAEPINGSDPLPQADENGEVVLPDQPPTKGVEDPALRPSPFDSVILRIMVDAQYLVANDTITNAPGISKVADQWLIVSIGKIETKNRTVASYLAALKNAATNISEERKLTGLVAVVAGPKLDAARKDNSLVKKNGSGQWVWQGKEVEFA